MSALGMLSELPLEALEVVFSFLEPQELVLLHIASATKVQALRQRLLVVRCAQHWLKLTMRLPSVERNTWNWNPQIVDANSVNLTSTSSNASEAASGSWVITTAVADMSLDDTNDGDAASSGNASSSGSSDHLSYHDENYEVNESTAAALAARQLSWRPCSKHQLLETLHQQVQHVNDLAALLHYWSACSYFQWSIQVKHLGLREWKVYTSAGTEKRLCGLEVPWDAPEGCYSDSMERLEEVIRQAFVLGHEGFLDFYRHQEDPRNKIIEFGAFVCGDVTYSLEFNDKLAFLCALFRLQQLPAEAVLARFHGMVSRLCRRDLLLLSSVLQLHTTSERHREERAANLQQAPATDVLDAFGQHEPYVQDLVGSLTVEERSSIMLCVASMVDNYVACFAQGVFLKVTFAETDSDVDGDVADDDDDDDDDDVVADDDV